MTFSNIDYSAYNISGGYAYNWVFARNFLFDISAQACLAYKRATNEVKSSNLKDFLDFDFRNLNIDGIVRRLCRVEQQQVVCRMQFRLAVYHLSPQRVLHQ